MNTLRYVLTFSLLSIFLFPATPTRGQFLKKLSKRVGEAAEEALSKKAEEKTARETEAAFDSVFNNSPQQKKVNYNEGDQGSDYSEGQNTIGSGNDMNVGNPSEAGQSSLEVYQKFDFTPGEKIMLYDDFSLDNMGDFPSRWDTNGSGELIKFSGSDDKWFKLVNNSVYIPDLPYDLPKEYTIEFDIATVGIDHQTSSVTRLNIELDAERIFQRGKNRVKASLPFTQYIDPGIQIDNHIDGRRVIYNAINADIRNDIMDQPHVSIAVNNQRFRLWINERKVIDVPRLVPKDKMKYIKLEINHFKEGKESVFIRNFKVAEGGLDLRHQLVSEGKFSTSGILFDVNSATIKPESYPVIKDIAQVLNENPSIKILVVGHTDSDGDDASNLNLSKQRAYSVKEFLTQEFSIDAGRIDADGKGETDPVDSNTTTTGKANNRRVEFIKI